jgi:Protein of unknown function (DUF3618)
MSSSEQQRLQKEIAELRGEMGETVEALVHKVDVPARAKERGSELAEQAVDRGVALTEQAVERGTELHQQFVTRSSEFSGRMIDWCQQLQARVLARSSEVREQAIATAQRARQTVSQQPPERWIKLASAGIALLTLMVITGRKRTG